MNMMGFLSGAEVLLDTHIQSDTLVWNHTAPGLPCISECYSLAVFSVAQHWLCSNYSPFLPLPSSLFSGSFTQHFPSSGGPGGWLSMSASDRSGAAFTLPKRAGRHSLLALVLHRTVESGASGSYYSVAEWVPCPLLFLLLPSLPTPLAELNHSQLRREGGGGWKRSRRAKTWNCSAISKKCDWLPLVYDFFTHWCHTYTHNRLKCPPMVTCHVLREEGLPHRNRKWKSTHIHRLPCVTMGAL